MRVALATRNPHKARDIRDLIGGAAADALVSLDELDVAPTPVEDEIEAYPTFRENALAKARHFCEVTGLPALADDSGLVVDALEGAPGVRSKRFAADAGRLGGGAAGEQSGAEVDEANNELLLERLRGVPPERRTAHYVCAAALVSPGSPAHTAVGTCPGRIARAPHGEGGFGYDPLFHVPALGATFGELGPDAKRRRSHRSRAIRAIADAVGVGRRTGR